MDRLTELEGIKENYGLYSSVQKRSLKDRLANIEVSDEELIRITKESSKAARKEVRKELINSIPHISAVTKAAYIFVDWNKQIDADLEEVKRCMLIESYLNKSDDHSKAIEELQNAISDYYGNALINKIFRMLSDYPPDGDLFEHLRTALNQICRRKKFKRMFDKHKFNLALIEKMTPQALTILADAQNWPIFNLKLQSGFFNGKVTDNFQRPFALMYAKEKDIKNQEKVNRISYIVSELTKEGFVECLALQGGGYALKLTRLGQELHEYLT